MELQIDATYSAEDNKLRLYASERLDSDLYQRVREAGFRWAPKQELFVAPKWTPSREDLAVELAGQITAEESTMAERAEAKAIRLEDLAVKRAGDSNSYHAAADRISERFYGGQPILVGHHSEKRARKDQERMRSAMRKAIDATDAARYWNYKAAGVERHANRKNNPRVVAGRIKTILKDLRTYQRQINHAKFCLRLWENMPSKESQENFKALVSHLAGVHFKDGAAAPYYSDYNQGIWNRLQEDAKNPIEPLEAVEICISFHSYQAESPYTLRWIAHCLNRLAYERGELGEISLFEGEITPVIIQVFAREMGADKPKAIKTETGFKLESIVDLPLHIGEGKTLELPAAAWRALMQAAGHTVPDKKASGPAKAPILNFKSDLLTATDRWGNAGAVSYPQIEMTKAEWARVNKDYKSTRVSACGQFRFRSKIDFNNGCSLVSVFLTDSKAHPAPQVDADRVAA